MCIDLETLSMRSNAVITAIAAVVWEEGSDPGDLVAKFEVFVDPNQPGRHICPDTVMWWFQQDSMAIKASYGEDLHRIPLDEALIGLEMFRKRWQDQSENPMLIWTNDPSFDAAILKDATNGNSPPWYYRNTRCCRTAFDHVTTEELEDLKIQLGTVKHAPLDDAHLSAATVQIYHRKSGLA